ncbi:hypothetical protein HanRHA438_Chr05g0222591 [Helianthus annuus]|nr:hypothetical protein HanRHA438_Chr05g0222591 [Helianthus annuus]
MDAPNQDSHLCQLKERKIGQTLLETDLQRRTTCTLRPFSLSSLLLVPFSLDQSICVGDRGTKLPRLC